jgi:hypothetical protein
MLTGIEPNQISLLPILAGSMVLFFAERIQIDLSAILTILILSLTGVPEPAEADRDSAANPLSSWSSFIFPCSL